jgi:hypothetical protein
MNPERIVGLYPRAWRDRYGEEFHQLLVDRIADGSAGRWWWVNPHFGISWGPDRTPRSSALHRR